MIIQLYWLTNLIQAKMRLNQQKSAIVAKTCPIFNQLAPLRSSENVILPCLSMITAETLGS